MRRLQNTLLSTVLVAGGLAAFSPAAHSADALAICNPGQPYLWPAGGANIPFNPDQGNLRDAAPTIDNPTGVALVQAAFDDWTAAGPYAVPTSATYTNAGQLPVDVDINNFGPYYNPPAPDGLSAIVFDADGQIFDLLFGAGSGILGFAGPEWGVPATCEITEGRAFLNGPAFNDLTAAEDVMMHEFGHYSNLGHVELNGQLFPFSEGGDTSGPTPDDPWPLPDPYANDVIESMFPFYFGSGSMTQSPQPDDVASISTLYPGPTFFATTGSISGTVYASDGVTRLSGVNVIARNVADPIVDAVSTFSGAYTNGTGQADPNVGVFQLNNLTPGAEYVVFVDQVTANPGRFSNPILATLPGPEEYWNTDEDSLNPPDDPLDATLLTAAAGSTIGGVDIVFNTPGPGDPLDVGDDGFVQLSIGFDFEICGQTFNSVFVNANGNLTFGASSSDFSESAAEFLSGPPRIAGVWDDLNPSAGGTVYYGVPKNGFSVTYDGIPEFLSTGSNTFTITLKKGSSNVDIAYDGLTATDGLAGVSCGGAITSGFEDEEDLSANGSKRRQLNNAAARYELFTGDSDLAGSTLKFTSASEFEDSWADEPNDSIADARHIKLPFNSIPVNRYTEIEPTGADVDYYAFSATGGTTFVAEILTGQLDTVLGLFDSGGALIAVDDDGGAGLLSRLQFAIPATGTYYLAVSTFPDLGFTGAGASGGRYVMDLFAIPGIVLNLGDDASQEVALGFDFPFQGGTYSSVFVNSNGNLTFGSGDTDFSESVGEFLSDQPRIAPLWDDLSPNNGGLVIVEYDTGEATVVFDSVPEFLSTGANTFMVTMRDDGSYTIEYGAVSAADGLTGTTEGGGAADPGETDLSAGGPFPASGTTYENAAGDLSGLTLEFEP